MITYDDFAKVDMRIGTIVHAEDFPRARNPAYKVKVDFGGDIGIKWSSVQAKNDYAMDALNGTQVVAIVNFPPKNIAGFMSEVLILGAPAEQGTLSLLTPGRPAQNGSRIY